MNFFDRQGSSPGSCIRSFWARLYRHHTRLWTFPSPRSFSIYDVRFETPPSSRRGFRKPLLSPLASGEPELHTNAVSNSITGVAGGPYPRVTTGAEEAMDFAFFVPSAYSPHALHDSLTEHLDVRRSHRHESGADQASVIMTTVSLY